MQLKASTDYALRTVVYLAMEDRVVSSKKISEEIAVPRDFLIQLAQLLRNAGIIQARAGKTGGYLLAKSPAEITLLDINRAIDEGSKAKEPVLDDNVLKAQAKEEPPVVESMHKALKLAYESFDAYLGSITIETLVQCTRDADNIDRYLARCLAQESRRLEAKADAEDLERHHGKAAYPDSLPLPNSVTVIPVDPPVPAAVASAPDVSQMESKSPAASIEWKKELPLD